ncbi:EAL domain-containing protein [Algiphilus sp. W345]|uniref:EAL domain-containing protein n=1 Tax=Banduia mediterranea TaxID=3075609 RepID=A0ABU2WD60_9GAMM|nr:EAL domain-containing protein [Algiphilus sp. W345]MDT0495813.1 EAL domain-containing protein [Algiphilus sp. W345]
MSEYGYGMGGGRIARADPNIADLTSKVAGSEVPGLDQHHVREVIEAAPNAMLMVNSRGEIVLANSQAEKLFGHTRDELLRKRIEVLIPRRFRQKHERYRGGFFTRPDTRAMGAGRDLYGLKKDGSEVPIEIGLNPINMFDGVFVLASIIDITERKRAEDRLRLVIEAAPNAMLMVNSRGEIVLVNSQVEKLFGHTRDELLGQRIESLIPERFRHHHKQYRGGFFARPDTRAMGAGRDLYGLKKDGTEVPIEIGLNPLYTGDEHFVLASVIDITERLNAQKLQRAVQVNTLRQSILDSLPFSIIATNTDGIILTANPAAERMLGYSRQELIGQSVLMIHDARELESRATVLAHQTGRIIAPNFQVIVAAGSQDAADEREWTYVCKDDRHVPVNLAITAMRDDSGTVNGFLKVAYDITERKRAEAFINHLAHHDALTDLPNRTMLLGRLEKAIRQSQHHGGPLAVLMIDLDHFKQVNDLLGHPVGDQLLLNIANRLQSRVRDADTVARLGGDEFVLVLTEIDEGNKFLATVERIMKAISEPMSIDGHELVITPSIGGCVFPTDGTDATTLLKYADTAMYCAKSAGRSNFQLFTPGMLKQAEEKLVMGTALRHAIEHHELEVYYQPEISLWDGTVIGMEALARWPNGLNGVAVTPDRFIPVAEETGLILQLGEWVLRTACRDCAAMENRLGRRMRVAVNVSTRQFQQKEWPTVVRRALEESGLQPHSLEIEITESMLMQNTEESAEMLHALRRLGVTVVVDDFGTGYSSLSYLTRFPIDKIKIDRSFVRDLDTDAADAAVINAIIAMAHSLDIRVVAEGVETEQQQNYLRARACDEAQGLRYSQAVSIDELQSVMAKIEAHRLRHLRCQALTAR